MQNEQFNNPMEEIVQGISRPQVTETIVADEENLYLFFSIDICNSTQMKSQVENWFEATKILYNEDFHNMHFWKYNGDEVLYAEPFTKLENLLDIISAAYIHIKSLQTAIKDRLVFESESVKQTFELKGSFWLARTSPYGSENKKNLFIKTPKVDEFLGLNIDEGFRISKKVSGSKLVIDSKIVYLALLAFYINSENKERPNVVCENDKFYAYAKGIDCNQRRKLEKLLGHLYFAHYANLKGIWNNRGYPIFWYYENPSDCEYDERIDTNYIEPKKVSTDWLDKLDVIFQKVAALDEFKNILLCVSEDKKSTYNYDSISRLYYSVACVNPISGRVLISKRSTCRKHLKNVWEFGMFKHSSGEVIKSLQKKYLDEFGIEIEILTDEEANPNILPLHFCTTYRNGQSHNNILCAAIIKGDMSDEEIINLLKENVDNLRFSEFRFVNSDNIDEYIPISLENIASDSFDAISNRANPFSDNSTIMYFKESVKAVQRCYENKKNNKKWFQ